MVEIYNDWYISANQYDVGNSSGTLSTYQKANIDKIYSIFSGLGWSDNAIAGMLGNMWYESCFDPACVYPKSSFPNGGATLADISNEYAVSRPNPAYGLVQWKGLSQDPPITNQIVSYAIRHDYQWYDGDIQMDRLTWEYQKPAKFHPQTVDGVYYTFESYSHSTKTPEELAIVWMKCYEGTDSVRAIRKANAKTCYDYIHGTEPEPPTPLEDWVTGSTFAEIAYGYRNSGYTYQQYDCIGFVNLCWKHIDNPPKSINLTNGTNSLWRSIRTFDTTDPAGDNPTLELYYKDTLENTLWYFGGIPQGALLFKCIPEGEAGYDTIPPQYYGDGEGNFTHVGIYVAPLGGSQAVMQSGGYGGSGVHLSGWQENYWTHVAFVVYVDCVDNPEPPEPPTPTPTWDIKKVIYLWYNARKKGVKRNVKFSG